VSSNKPSSTAQQIFDLYNKDQQMTIKKENKSQTNLLEKEIEASLFSDIAIETTEPTVHVNEANENEQPKEQNAISNSSLSLNKETESLSDMQRTQSINSLSSTLTSVSQQQKREQRQQLVKQQMAELPEWIKENERVIVSTSTAIMNKPGHIRYIGPTKFAHGVWIGVELDDPVGKNDGSYNGVSYFSCAKNKGVFVRQDKLTLFVNKI
jgi:hypothetical protein